MSEPELEVAFSPLRILLVEDDNDLRTSLTEVLEEEGYIVVAVSSGTEAIVQAADHVFDLVVTDIKTTGTDGLTALEQVKSEQPEVAGIVITGYSTEETATRAAKMRVENYLKKPFKRGELLAAVDRLADRKRQEQRKEAHELAVQQGLRWLSGQLFASRESRSSEELERFFSAAVASGFAEYRDPREQVALQTATLLQALQSGGLEVPGSLTTILPLRLSHQLAAEQSGGLKKRLQELAESLRLVRPPVVEEDPESPEDEDGLHGSLLNVALLLESTGRPAEARLALLDVLRASQDPGQVYLAHFGLARLARQQRDFAELDHHVDAGVAAAEQLGPLAYSEALTERGLLLSLAQRQRARVTLLEAQEAAKQVKDTTSFALSGLALAHFHGATLGNSSRLLSYLHQPEHFTAAVQSSGWLLAHLLGRTACEEEKRFLQKLVRACPRSFEHLAAHTTDPEFARHALPFLDLLNEPAKLRVLERFQSLGDGQLLRQLSLLQSHEQRQIQRSSVLRVYSFSGMLIFRDDEAIDMKRKKPLLLLIYLLYRDRPVGDQTLLEHFWPGDENKGRTSLRSAMSYLRKLLSPDSPAEPFERQASGISVAKWVNVWFDYREFEQLVAQGQTHQGFNPQRAVECFRGAVKLCRGPFLENIYEDWALEVRERSEQLLESCLRFLGEQCLAAESWAEAYEHASRALRRDDLSQPFYEMAMKALIELGRHHDAITLFEQGKVRLHRELELEPSIEMMRLRQMAHLNV